MEFRVQYRAEDVQNKSPRIVFPGFSRFGESHWVTAQDYYGVKIENFPTSFVKQDAIASWRWDLSSRVTMAADYQFESWKRTFRDAARTNENSFHGQLDAKLLNNLKLRTDYKYSDREASVYTTVPMSFNAATNTVEVTSATVYTPGVPLEFSRLRRFDETAVAPWAETNG